MSDQATPEQVLEQVRAEMFEEFGGSISSNQAQAKWIIEACSRLRLNEFASWGPGVAVVIRKTSNARHPCFDFKLHARVDIFGAQAWQRISDKIDGFHCERSNQYAIAVISDCGVADFSAMETIVDALTPDARREFFSLYCKHCRGFDTKGSVCDCWSDE